MKRVIVNEDSIIGPWVCQQAGGSFTPGRGVTIGLIDLELKRILAGVIYEDWNGANIFGHMALDLQGSCLPKAFLEACFDYPFRQLNCQRITGIVPSSNHKARQFDERLGFVHEATLKDAHPEGDLLLYVMRRENCRWLNITRRKPHGQESNSASLQ